MEVCLLWGIIFAKPNSAVLEQFRDSQLVENNVNIALYCFLNKKTGFDEYVEDQWNVASKISPNIRLMNNMEKKYLEDICSMKGLLSKKAILNFFLGMT